MATFIGALGIAAGIIELTVRWDEEEYLVAMRKKYEGRELCVHASNNPDLIYELVPNKCGHNSIGQKDIEHIKAKPNGVFRIGVIGDSVTEGLGIELEEGYPRVLESILIESGYQVEVLKFAVRGYTTVQELALLDSLEFDRISSFGVMFSMILLILCSMMSTLKWADSFTGLIPTSFIG